MLTTGAKPEPKLRFIKHNIGCHQHKQGHQHKPVKLKPPYIDNKRSFGRAIGYGGGNIIHALRRVNGSHQNHCRRRAEKIQRRAHKCLIRLKLNRRNAKQQGEKHTQQHACQNNQQNGKRRRHAFGDIFHHERAAQRTDYHDSFQTDIDHTAMLRKASAECHEHKDRSKYQRILN